MQVTYEKSLAEVFKTIESLNYEEYNRISKKFLENIYKNMDRDYYLMLDVDDDFIDNKMSETAKEILALIYRDYLVSPEERQQLLKEETEEEKRIEQELREKYNPDNIFKRNNSIDSKEVEETSLVIKEDEVWYKRFINKILTFFKRKIK